MRRRRIAAVLVILACAVRTNLSSASDASLPLLGKSVSKTWNTSQVEPPLAIWVNAPSQVLAQSFASVLATQAALDGLSPFTLVATDAAGAEQEARRKIAGTLLRVEVDLSAGQLRARGDLIRMAPNFWAGQSFTKSSRSLRVFAEQTLADATALQLSQPTATTGTTSAWKLEAIRIATLPSRPAAIASGDWDGDDEDEWWVLLQTELLVLHATTGQVRARMALPTPAPGTSLTREPFGTLTWVSDADGQRSLWVSSGQWAGSLRVTFAHANNHANLLTGDARSEVVIDAGPTPLTGNTVPGMARFGTVWSLGSQRFRFVQEPLCISAKAAPRSTDVLAVFADGSGALWDSASLGTPRTISGLGVSALADLDGDGRAEIITTEAAVTPVAEKLRVLDLDGKLERAVVPLNDRALVVTRLPTANAPDRIVAGIWKNDGTGELWLVGRKP